MRGAFTAFPALAGFPPDGFSFTARVGRLEVVADFAAASLMLLREGSLTLLPEGPACRATFGWDGFPPLAAILRS